MLSAYFRLNMMESITNLANMTFLTILDGAQLKLTKRAGIFQIKAIGEIAMTIVQWDATSETRNLKFYPVLSHTQYHMVTIQIKF